MLTGDYRGLARATYRPPWERPDPTRGCINCGAGGGYFRQPVHEDHCVHAGEPAP